MKNTNRLDASIYREKAYRIFAFVVIAILAFLFAFPLYWIITGAFKTKADIMNTQPVWIPTEWVMTNFENLMSKRSAPLFDLTFGGWRINAFGYTKIDLLLLLSRLSRVRLCVTP